MKSKSLNDSEFVVKITDMMREYTEIVDWNEDGTELVFKDLEKFINDVLPQYFRHSNFNSFVRQLNVYSFYKTKNQDNMMSFKNQIFRKGNENNFFLIQRKKKFKVLQNYQQRFEKQCEQLISEVMSKNKITPQTKEALIFMLEYKYTSHANLQSIKSEIEDLCKQLKDSRNKKIQEICKEFKKDFQAQLKQLCSESKNIDRMVARNFLKQSQETKECLEPILNQKVMNQYFQLPFEIDPHNAKNKSATKDEFRSMQIYNGYGMNLHMFFDEMKNKRQQLFFQPKSYLPFASQNGFMILPSYLPVSSHLKVDEKFNFFQKSRLSRISDFQEKNINLYQDDESASMSFVNIPPEDEKFQFFQAN